MSVSAPSCFLYGLLTSSSCLAAQFSHPALLHCWRSWEGNVSLSFCCCFALHSTDSHSPDYCSISSHSSLSLSVPLPSPSPSGWTISWLTDIGSLCSCMFANLLTPTQEFASPLPDSFSVCRLWGKRGGRGEAMLPVLRGKEASGFLRKTDDQTFVSSRKRRWKENTGRKAGNDEANSKI